MKWFVILLVLLVACLPATLKRQPQIPEINVGTSSLEISFNPASVSNILMCKNAEIFVDLRNKGTYNITDGRYVWIFENQILKSVDEPSKSFSIEGKSRVNPLGGLKQDINFKIENTNLPSQIETYSSPVVFQACYNYETFASVPVCIDPDIRGLNKVKPCQTKTVTLSGGQGAPVAVTKVETAMLPENNKVRPIFAVFVQNLGVGQVIQPSDIDFACRSGETQGRFLNFADVEVTLQNSRLECAPSPTRIESGQETKFICQSPDITFDMAKGTFNTFLSINLKYGYVNNAVFPLTITRLPGQKPCDQVNP